MPCSNATYAGSQTAPSHNLITPSLLHQKASTSPATAPQRRPSFWPLKRAWSPPQCSISASPPPALSLLSGHPSKPICAPPSTLSATAESTTPLSHLTPKPLPRAPPHRFRAHPPLPHLFVGQVCPHIVTATAGTTPQQPIPLHSQVDPHSTARSPPHAQRGLACRHTPPPPHAPPSPSHRT